ncbi:AAA family ATPase [Lachnospiraceae bacterium WCA-9-b2]|uniref:AAA family ATPase n=1 Tax=Sporofaciens musculi TaxID=2681861 RepID=A0A7X3SL94_9FIRM|nr:UvrD-helicase domain-containing protein [Sporofaciens musculi]MXP78175.1 AAA family ATPase [Sporofaciens musculi]
MSRGSDFLKYVISQLKIRLQTLDETICEVQKDIAKMNKYYWENYTEMDQYGYENYDNQQALFGQVSVSQEHQRQRSRYRKMLDSPFFGSVDFLYDGEEEPESFYIGIGNFARERGGVPLIYDWRAPVSGLFYDFDKGAASYQAPAGEMEGEILSKWQYKIRGGRMLYEFESDMKIDDDILKQELSANSDTQLKNIVRTIQREQNAIIRNTKDKVLIIQGAAGSGKTSIALHRIAYLLYHNRGSFNSSNILILSPNSVFSDYISHILPELGEENIQEMSFDLFAYRQLKEVAKDCEDRWDQIEKQMQRASQKASEGEGGFDRKNIADTEQDKSYQWKQSKEYVAAVEGFLVELEDRLVDFKDIQYGKMVKKAEDILHMFYFRFQNIPLLSRMDAVMEYFVDECETLWGRNLAEEELESVKEQFGSMYVTTDIYEIYNWLLEETGQKPLLNLPREERILAYEDVYPLLYLKYRLLPVADHRNIRHLVIDEMQDYSYLQYVILERMFSCNMTILGDRAQTVDAEVQDVLTFLPDILGKKVRKLELNRSYRNTWEIAEYANGIAKIQGIQYMKRHGRNVEEIQCISYVEAIDRSLERVRLGEDGYETAAILVMTQQEARAIYEDVRRRRSDVSYIDRDSECFQKGITVTTFYMAKGLEFDQVFVAGGDEGSPFFPQFMYICATRALHELYVLRYGP